MPTFESPSGFKNLLQNIVNEIDAKQNTTVNLHKGNTTKSECENTPRIYISQNELNDAVGLDREQLLKKYPKLSDRSKIERILDINLKVFVKMYICGVDIPYGRWENHDKIAEFTFQFFTNEELISLIDLANGEIGSLFPVSAYLEKENSVTSLTYASIVDRMIGNLTEENRRRLGKKDLCDLKAFIHILDMILIKNATGYFKSNGNLDGLDVYSRGLKVKYQKMHDAYRFNLEAIKIINGVRLEIASSGSNSVAILEINPNQAKSLVVSNVATYIKKELAIPLVIVPTTMKLTIVDEKKEDNSISELEV